jgi:hypothetical protein
VRNAAIFSFVKVSDNSMVASVRIARWLHEFLDAPLIWDEGIGECKDLGVLVIVNGAYGFSKCLEPLSRAILGAERIVWVQNDYTIIPPKDEGDAQSPFRRAFVTRKERGDRPVSFWSTCHKWSERPGSSYVNWNALTFDPSYDLKVIARRRKSANDQLFYYGSFRDGSGKSSRVPLFDRYFKDPKVPTKVSSPVKKFEERYPGIVPMGAITENFYEALGTKGLGLYIEDRKSSEEFHSPANRFYEMLSAGLPMVFAPECGTMLRKAGYNPEPYVVRNAREVEGFMRKREEIGAQQRAEWIPDKLHFRDTLINQVCAAREALFK